MQIHRQRLVWPLLITTVLLVGSLTRAPALPAELSFIGYDKVGHFCVYGMLAVAWLRVFAGKISLSTVLLAAAIASLTGVVDEGIQFFNPGRTYDFADMLMDMLGACAGAFVYQKATALRCLLELKPFVANKSQAKQS